MSGWDVGLFEKPSRAGQRLHVVLHVSQIKELAAALYGRARAIDPLTLAIAVGLGHVLAFVDGTVCHAPILSEHGRGEECGGNELEHSVRCYKIKVVVN
jgi:hypothetical protein